MQNPLITIGLTTYNAEDTVRKALDSAFNQTWRPFEVVAVDDCSHDGTWQILEEYAQKHSEMRIFRNETNGGVAVSRNRILAEAKGEFIAFFDDDDVSLPERLTAQCQRIIEHEKECPPNTLIVCHTARRVFYPDGKVTYRLAMGQDREQPIPAGIAVARRILIGTHIKNYGVISTCVQMARLSVYQAAGGFDILFRRGQDTELAIRWAELGCHFVGIAEPLVEQFMTATIDKNVDMLYKYELMSCNKHRNIMEATGQYSFCLQWKKGKYLWKKGKTFLFLVNLLLLFFTYPVSTFLHFVQILPDIKEHRAARDFFQQIK